MKDMQVSMKLKIQSQVENSLLPPSELPSTTSQYPPSYLGELQTTSTDILQIWGYWWEKCIKTVSKETEIAGESAYILNQTAPEEISNLQVTEDWKKAK